MSSSDEGCISPTVPQKKFKGVRRRKWGKWVSEIRVPGTQDRLWLGSYVAPEAAAVAHDIAYYCLRERTSLDDFNFPLVLPVGVERGMSPRSVQKVATDAGMAIDAQFIAQRTFDFSMEINENAVNSRPDRQRWPSQSDHSVQSLEMNENTGERKDVEAPDTEAIGSFVYPVKFFLQADQINGHCDDQNYFYMSNHIVQE